MFRILQLFINVLHSYILIIDDNFKYECTIFYNYENSKALKTFFKCKEY